MFSFFQSPDYWFLIFFQPPLLFHTRVYFSNHLYYSTLPVYFSNHLYYSTLPVYFRYFSNTFTIPHSPSIRDLRVMLHPTKIHSSRNITILFHNSWFFLVTSSKLLLIISPYNPLFILIKMLTSVCIARIY